MIFHFPVPDSPLSPPSQRVKTNDKVCPVPMRDRHEFPVNVASTFAIGYPWGTQIANDASRTEERYTDVTTAGVVHVNCDGDML
jgi:hypothetical protein